MAHFTPIRDLAGSIVGWTKGSAEDTPQFTAMLAETMQAVGVAEQAPAEQPARPVGRGRYEAGTFVLGVLAALALIIGLGLGRNTPAPATRSMPTARAATAPALPTRTSAPTIAPSATIAPTDAPPTPEPPTAEPPTPEPVIIQAPPPPPIQCYTVSQTVYDARGYPIGVAEGYSCDSQEEAQANADAQAEQLKAAHH